MSPRTRPAVLVLGTLAVLGVVAGPAAATPSPDDVVLEATMEPQNVFAAPGSVVPLEATVTNTGTADMTGGSADFEVTGDATVAGVEGGDGCEQVSPQRIECRTDATLAAGESATATFLVQLPDNVSEVVVGEATLHVAGDNGGEDTVTSILEVGPHEGYEFRVMAPASAEGAAGDTVDLLTTVANVGSVDVDGASLEVEVPDGASVAGAAPDEGCTVVTPRRLECHTAETLVAYDGSYEVTVQVRFDDDAPAGELGVATIRGAGDEGGEDTVDTTETVLTVTETGGTETGGTETGGTESGGAESGGDESGGTELPNTGGDELADTGSSQAPVLLAGLALLAAGGTLLLRTRRA